MQKNAISVTLFLLNIIILYARKFLNFRLESRNLKDNFSYGKYVYLTGLNFKYNSNSFNSSVKTIQTDKMIN